MSPELTSHSNLHSSPSHLSLRSLTYDLSSSPSRGNLTRDLTRDYGSSNNLKVRGISRVSSSNDIGGSIFGRTGAIANSFDEPEITHNLDSTPQIKITKNDAIEYLYSLPSKLISSLLHPSSTRCLAIISISFSLQLFLTMYCKVFINRLRLVPSGARKYLVLYHLSIQICSYDVFFEVLPVLIGFL